MSTGSPVVMHSHMCDTTVDVFMPRLDATDSCSTQIQRSPYLRTYPTRHCIAGPSITQSTQNKDLISMYLTNISVAAHNIVLCHISTLFL